MESMMIHTVGNPHPRKAAMTKSSRDRDGRGVFSPGDRDITRPTLRLGRILGISWWARSLKRSVAPSCSRSTDGLTAWWVRCQ